MVTARTADTISLSSGAVVAVYPARPQPFVCRARIVVWTKWTTWEPIDGKDMARARCYRRAATLAMSGGKLVLLSSPGRYGSTFHRSYRSLGTESRDVLVLRPKASDVNRRVGRARYSRRPMQGETPHATEGGRLQIQHRPLLVVHAAVSPLHPIAKSSQRNYAVSRQTPSAAARGHRGYRFRSDRYGDGR